MSCRSYATARTIKPRTRKPASTKPTARKTATKKAGRKPLKKKKKVVAAKPKSRGRRKKVLTPEAKAKIQLKELKSAALLQMPKGKPSSAWLVVMAETVQASANGKAPGAGEQRERLSSAVKEAAARYRSLSPSELEQYNHLANQNKTANEAALKAWIEAHTPEEIRIANNARTLLNKKAGLKGNGKISKIQDSRIPKRARTPLALFSQDRWGSGDLRGVKVTEGAALLSKEWAALPASERKSYEDRAAQDKQRYFREFKAAFNRDAPVRATKAAA